LRERFASCLIRRVAHIVRLSMAMDVCFCVSTIANLVAPYAMTASRTVLLLGAIDISSLDAWAKERESDRN
jgi:hypothetical protein